MPLILGTNSIKDTGYNVDNSVRFDDGSNDELYRSQSSSPSSRRLFTFSAWVKRGVLNSGGSDPNKQFFSQHNDTSDRMDFRFQSGDTIDFYSNTPRFRITTSKLFRDCSAFYHVCLRVDTTQSTASNRVRLYINGVQETSFSTADYGDQNDDLGTNYSTFKVGDDSYGTSHFDGYMCEVVYCDGQSLDPTSFGEFDSDSPNIWKPIDVSGLTFGTNGFYLDFKDSSALGNDVSGNNNDFSINGLLAVDQSTDTCTNNFATLNPLLIPTSNAPVFAEGNLRSESGTTGGMRFMGGSTIGVTKGKWYVEAKVLVIDSILIGVSGQILDDALNNKSAGNGTTGVSILLSSGNKYIADNGTTHGDAFSANDILMIALDMDNENVYFGRNGNWFDGSGNADESSPNSAIGLVTLSSTPDGAYFFHVGDGGGSAKAEAQFNFGSPPYAISSGNADANGYGNFEYAVPSGYYALNTKNLAEFG